MTTLTVDTAPRRRAPQRLRNAMTAELTKLRSVRSTYWSLIGAAITTIAIAAIAGAAMSSMASNAGPGDDFAIGDPTAVSLSGLLLGQLIIAGLGVRAITSEYSTGLIRTSLAAVPRRRTLLLAKIAVVGAVTLVSGVLISLGSFAVGQAMLGADYNVSLGDPGVFGTILGAGFYVSVVALVGLGLGTVIRHKAGTLTTLVGIVFILPGSVGALPESWSGVHRWLLSSAGDALVTSEPLTGAPSTSRALLICLLWVGGSLGAAAYAISKRDA